MACTLDVALLGNFSHWMIHSPGTCLGHAKNSREKSSHCKWNMLSFAPAKMYYMLHVVRYSWWWLLDFCASAILALLRFTRELSLPLALDYTSIRIIFHNSGTESHLCNALFGTFVGLAWLPFKLFSFGSRQLYAPLPFCHGYPDIQNRNADETEKRAKKVKQSDGSG